MIDAAHSFKGLVETRPSARSGTNGYHGSVHKSLSAKLAAVCTVSHISGHLPCVERPPARLRPHHGNQPEKVERRGFSQISQVRQRVGPLADPHGTVSQAMEATHGQAVQGDHFSEKPSEDACAYLVGCLEPVNHQLLLCAVSNQSLLLQTSHHAHRHPHLVDLGRKRPLFSGIRLTEGLEMC